MHKDDILNQYAYYAKGYLKFLAEKRKEIESSMAQLQRRPVIELPREIPGVEEVIQKVIDERPPWSILPVVVEDAPADGPNQRYDGVVGS